MDVLLWLLVFGLSSVFTSADSDEATLQSIKQDVAAVKKSNKDILEEVRKIYDFLQTSSSFNANAELSARQSQSPGVQDHNGQKKERMYESQHEQMKQNIPSPVGLRTVHVKKEENSNPSPTESGVHWVEKEEGSHKPSLKESRTHEHKEQASPLKNQQLQHPERQLLPERHPHQIVNDQTEKQRNISGDISSPNGDHLKPAIVTKKPVIGEGTRQSNQRTLVISSQGALMMYSIRDGKMVKIKRVPVHVPIDSMAYDDQRHYLYWSSKRRGLIGVKDSGFHDKIILRSKDITGNIALDSRKRKLYFFIGFDRGSRLVCVDLSGKHIISMAFLRNSNRPQQSLQLMVDSRTSTIYVLKRMGTRETILKAAFREEGKWSKGVTMNAMRPVANIGSALFAQDANKFLFCHTNHEMVAMSMENNDLKRIGHCPSDMKALVYFRGTLGFVREHSMVLAVYDNTNGSLVNMETLHYPESETPLAAAMTELQM